jgi:hypothetical protein
MLEADLHGRRVGFKDGGIRENNPSYAAYSEHASLRGDNATPALLLSVGTGRPDHSKDGFASGDVDDEGSAQNGFASAWPGPFGMRGFTKKWAEKFAVFKNVLIKYTEGEERHKMMRTIAKGEHHWYKRLNVTTGLENMKLDNWEKGPRYNPKTRKMETVPGGKTLSWMEKVTDDYLTREKLEVKGDAKGKRDFKGKGEYAAPKTMLAQTAEKLVRHRRARERMGRGDFEVEVETRSEEERQEEREREVKKQKEMWEGFMGVGLPFREER